jgi:signal transduction histidine kinase
MESLRWTNPGDHPIPQHALETNPLPSVVAKILTRRLPKIEQVVVLPSHRIRHLERENPLTTGSKVELAWQYLRQGNAEKSLALSGEARVESILSGDMGTLREAIRANSFACNVLGQYFNVREGLSLLSNLGQAGIQGSEIAATEVDGWLQLRTASFENGKYFTAQELLERVRDAAHIAQDWNRETETIYGLACAIAGQGAYMKAVEMADFGLQRCEATGCWNFAHHLLLARTVSICDLGYHAAADQEFLMVLELCEALEDRYALARTQWYRGNMPRYTFEGRGEEPTNTRIRSMRAGIRTAESIGCLPLAFTIRVSLMDVLKLTGTLEGFEEEREELKKVNLQLRALGAGEATEEWLLERLEMDRGREKRKGTLTRRVVESSPDAIFVFDQIVNASGSTMDFRTQIRNSAADRLIQGLANEVYSLSLICEHPFLKDLFPRVTEAIATAQPYEDEIKCEMEGVQRWFLRRIVPVDYSAAICLSETTMYHVAAERAHQADEAKSRFLATMSHEIRTPISGVLGLARMLASVDLDAQQRVWVDGIIAGADILLGVVGGVLDLSKIEAGHLAIEPAPFEPGALIQNLYSLYQGLAFSKGLELTYSVGPNVPDCVSIDSTRLGQVLANLVNNAIKFTERGGVHLALNRKGNQMVFEVSDTGCGIEPESLEVIFEAFTQARNSNSRAGGTGLGLAIAKKMVGLMGGNLTAESEVNAGSTFSFAIPIVEVASSPERACGDIPDGRFAGFQVLLAEDNPTNAMVAKFQLERLGCEVRIVTDGVQAVDAALKNVWDVIFMDMQMPIMGGVEATREIRRRDRRHTPIIALTANALAEEREKCLQAGMDDFLTKPFLAKAVKVALEKWTVVAQKAA